jgi:hypothetical protein
MRGAGLGVLGVAGSCEFKLMEEKGSCLPGVRSPLGVELADAGVELQTEKNNNFFYSNMILFIVINLHSYIMPGTTHEITTEKLNSYSEMVKVL